MSTFGELVDRVMGLTGLEPAQASEVAQQVMSVHGDTPSAAQIVDSAAALGHDVDVKHAPAEPPPLRDQFAKLTPEERMAMTLRAALEPLGLSMDPAEVITEVYLVEPRVLHRHTPKLGRAPEEAYEHFSDVLKELPEEIVAALVKIDLYEGKATFWLRDEANDVDRPIGPIDLARYPDIESLSDALNQVFKRLDRVFVADMN